MPPFLGLTIALLNGIILKNTISGENMNTVFEKAYAKINLTLDIVGLLPNGYHLLESIMQPISLCDGVKVSRLDGIGVEIICEGSNMPTDNSNTMYKATTLFMEQFGLESKIVIEIEKKIPMQAGLGGGSADAAAVLRALNELFDYPSTQEQLLDIASKVGADVPFCVINIVAHCSSFGEIVKPIDQFDKMYLLLVKPDFGITTPEAYKAFDEKKLSSKFATRKVMNGENLLDCLSNDLENAVTRPEIEEIKSLLIENGAKASLMTGSGSCVFGIFESKDDCESAEAILSEKYPFVKACETI